MLHSLEVAGRLYGHLGEMADLEPLGSKKIGTLIGSRKADIKLHLITAFPCSRTHSRDKGVHVSK